jgi:hypothetical protein
MITIDLTKIKKYFRSFSMYQHPDDYEMPKTTINEAVKKVSEEVSVCYVEPYRPVYNAQGFSCAMSNQPTLTGQDNIAIGHQTLHGTCAVSSMSDVFQGCTSLCTIPKDLFNNINVHSLYE